MCGSPMLQRSLPPERFSARGETLRAWPNQHLIVADWSGEHKTARTWLARLHNLEAAGCSKIYREKVSGAKTDRPVLAKLLRGIEPGDALIVSRLDRLARSTRDLLNILDVVVKAGAGFPSLKDSWADSTTPHGRLMLTVLGGLAEFERELIRARTGEGRSRAKARGVQFGRPPKLTAHQRQEALQRLARGETQADIARTYNVDATTIGRLEPRPFEHPSASVGSV
jgi:DNA invertase Pin-like site-specific DNA recombinase